MASIFAFISTEHLWLNALLASTLGPAGDVDVVAFDAFRRELLGHIAQEQKVFMLALLEREGPRVQRVSKGLEADHEAIATLVVPTPHRDWVRVLSELFVHHHELEEGTLGLYPLAGTVLADVSESLVAKARACPALKVKHGTDWRPLLRPHLPGPA